MDQHIVNKVAQSGLITIDLEDIRPSTPIVAFDLRNFLFEGVVLREKDFRQRLGQTDWSAFEGKAVAITCTADAIVPMWAFMLAAAHLSPVAHSFLFGTPADMEAHLYRQAIDAMDLGPMKGGRVIVKGCGKHPVPEAAYVHLSALLLPMVQSLMFGEACSTVPIFKAGA